MATSLVEAPIVKAFERKLGKHWIEQEVKYNYEADLSTDGRNTLDSSDSGGEAWRLRPAPTLFRKFRQDGWFGDGVVRLCTIRFTVIDEVILINKSCINGEKCDIRINST